MPRAWILTALLAMVVVGGALRAYRLGYQSLWNDEIVTWISAQGSPWHVITQREENSNIPPLYYLVASASLALRNRLGLEAALRVPSVLVGVLSIPLLFLVVRTWLDERVALLASVAMTISPFHVWYSQEARPYALLLFLSLVALYCLQRALAEPGRWEWKAGTAVAAAATFYCHTVGVAFIAFVVTYVALATRDPDPEGAPQFPPRLAAAGDPAPHAPQSWLVRARGWITAFVVMIVLCLPGVYRLATFPPTVSADSSRTLTPLQFGYALWSFAVGYSYGPSLDELHTPDRDALLRHYATTVVPLGLVLLVLTALGAWSLSQRYRRSRLAVALWLLFPVAFVALGAVLTVHPFNVRYTIISFFPALVLIVVGLDALPGRAIRGLAWMGVGAVSAVALYGYYTDPRYARDDDRGAGAFLEAHATPNALVVAHRAFTARDLGFYAPLDTNIVPFPRERGTKGNDLRADLEETVAGAPRVWLFLSRGTPDEDAPLKAFFDQRFHRTDQYQSSGVQLIGYARDSAVRSEPAAHGPAAPVSH
jgi:4-amino-4-deoxy-L-arabinose transferase-like glycosyltransferase